MHLPRLYDWLALWALMPPIACSTDTSSTFEPMAPVTPNDSPASGSSGASDGGSGDGGSGGNGGNNVAGGQATSGLDASACDSTTYDFAELTTTLNNAVSGETVRGVSFALVRAGCPPIYEQAVGTIGAQDILPIASASKVPAATVMMALADRGKLSLDDKVSKYLDFWPADKADITLRFLLAHTSGLPGLEMAGGCLSDSNSTLDQCARLIASLELAGPPGTVFAYGGADFQVAGRVAEVVSGKSWNELFADLVARPCGAPTLSFAAGPENPLGSDTNPRIAGGAATNAADYVKMLGLHASGGWCGATRVLSADSVLEMQKDQVGFPISSAVYPGHQYGLGWWLEPSPEGSSTVFSDPGAFGAFPWVDTKRQYGAFLLIKEGTKKGIALFADIEPVVARAIDNRVPRLPPG